jgi:hypothetical protein
VDYLTANSIVRPPSSPTLTPVMTNGAVTSVTVDWKAPAFGVVQYYTVYRGCNPNGSDAVNIGVVNGVGGAAPATEFIDSNPVTCSGSSTVVYTISTTLNPVQIDPTQRSSAPSVPAIVKNLQTIVLGSLQSSVTYSDAPPPVMVTAIAETNGSPNGLQVNFVATGPCSVTSQTVGSVSNGTGGVSTATVSVNDPGSNPASCTITASQPGTNPTALSTPPYYDAANSVSESFTIEPAGSTLQSQTITFAPVGNVQYGKTFSLSASSNSRLAITFASAGPCTTSGTTTGVGQCTITASQMGNSTYSSASVSQSFSITPAVLTVTATSFPSVPYGQPIPTLTYAIKGYVNNDLTSVVSGAPALSTTAASLSPVGTYPITISTGSLAAANYSFLFVPGTLTITPGPFVTVSPSSINFGSVTLDSITTHIVTVSNTGSAAATISTPLLSLLQAENLDEFVVVNLCPSSLAAGKSCPITVSFVAGAYYNTAQTATLKVMDNAPGSPQGIMLSATVLATPTISISDIPASPVYGGSFTAKYLYSGTGSPTESVASSTTSVCTASGSSVSFVGVGTCTLKASATATTADAAVTGSAQSFTVGKAAQAITFTTNPPPSAANKSAFKVAATASSGLTVTFTASGSCSVPPGSATYTMTSATGTCSVIANQAGNSDYAAAAQVTKTVTAKQ